uniref:S8 family serine peptidase n=1 Tax=Streptomyces corallincola TaxID=2851888 RepID=UPI001FEC7F8F|nr:S8 family serine peptidase [Streptomyces corallincola]
MNPRHRRRRGLLVAALSLLALSTPALSARATAAATPTGGTPADVARVPSGTHSVTLITGDVVTTRAEGTGGTVSVTGPDGSAARARVIEAGDHLYVYPDAALPYVARKVLDRRLFDITGLVADGYDDSGRDGLPLIVSYDGAASLSAARRSLPGATVRRALDSVDGAALTASRSRAADFWTALTAPSTGTALSRGTAASPLFSGGVTHVWLDGRVHADLAESTAQIGVPAARAGGNTGRGVDVAVLDSGADSRHPDLATGIVAARSFVPGQDAEDRNGHGTHVASTIAGTGAASGGREQGVAPGASLHIGKVLDDTGSGQDSWVLAGMEWAAVDQRAAVINMSLGSDTPSDGTDPVSAAVNRLSAQTGALFVVAAGNTGTPGSIGGPGAADAALTVGAVDADDNVAFFSSQGPRVGDGAVKPEITAPGVDILAARAHLSPEGQGDYLTLSGTSMATPHVAGVAALAAAAHPGLTGGELRSLLTSTSVRTPHYDAFQGGSGRVDAAAAARSSVFATATAWAGHEGTSPVTRPLTYTNLSAAPVVLSLSVDAPGAPAGLFRLQADRVTVPAHGTARATLTIDPSRGAVRERFSGQVVAARADGTVAAHTAVGLGDVNHKLTLVLKDGDGRPMSGVVEVLASGRYEPDFYVVDETGTAQAFLPDTVYSVLSFKDVRGAHGPRSLGMALLGDPDVTLDRDRTVTLDASKVTRIDMTTPLPTETTYQRLEYNRSMGGARWRDFMETQTAYDSLWAQPQAGRVSHGDFHLAARWRKEKPGLAVSTPAGAFTDVLRQGAVTPLPEGRHRLPLRYAGSGRSADYTGLDARGAAVVVRRDPGVGDAAQAAAAARAGARLMLVVNDQPGRRFTGYGDGPGKRAAVDVGLLSPDEGDRLARQAAARGAAVTVDSSTASPYVYDLMRTWHNEVPRDLVVRGSERNLARIDEVFASPDSTRGGGEFRFDWPSYSQWAIGTTMRLPVNSGRVDWVSTDGEYTWGQEAYVDSLLYEIAPRTSYRPGERREQQWFTPVARPYLNNNYHSPARTGDRLSFDIPGYGGGDRVGMSMDYERGRQTLTLYQGGARIAQGTGTVLAATAPSAGPLPYRLVVDTGRDASFSPYSSATSTEWTFTSGAPGDGGPGVLPLLQADWRLATDTAGRAARDSRFRVGLEHPAGAVGAGRPEAPVVEVSYDDGRGWQRLRPEHDGGFRLDAPRRTSFVSLRVSARDSAGNGIRQTIVRAAGLR